MFLLQSTRDRTRGRTRRDSVRSISASPDRSEDISDLGWATGLPVGTIRTPRDSIELVRQKISLADGTPRSSRGTVEERPRIRTHTRSIRRHETERSRRSMATNRRLGGTHSSSVGSFIDAGDESEGTSYGCSSRPRSRTPRGHSEQMEVIETSWKITRKRTRTREVARTFTREVHHFSISREKGRRQDSILSRDNSTSSHEGSRRSRGLLEGPYNTGGSISSHGMSQGSHGTRALLEYPYDAEDSASGSGVSEASRETMGVIERRRDSTRRSQYTAGCSSRMR